MVVRSWASLFLPRHDARRVRDPVVCIVCAGRVGRLDCPRRGVRGFLGRRETTLTDTSVRKPAPTQTRRRLPTPDLVPLVTGSEPQRATECGETRKGAFGNRVKLTMAGGVVDFTDPTVFVVWHEPATGARVVSLIQSRGMRCALAGSADEFLRRFHPSCTGCILLHLSLPDMTGLELLEYLPGLYHPFPAVVVGEDVDVPSAVRAMRAGAVTVLSAPFADADLLSAVDSALNISHNVQDAHSRRARLDARFEQLDLREQEVVSMIVAGRPYKAIARELGVSHRTIDRICASVYQKTGTSSAVDLARAVGELARLRNKCRELRCGQSASRAPVLNGCVGDSRDERQYFVDDCHGDFIA